MKFHISVSDLFLVPIVIFLFVFPAFQYSAIGIRGIFDEKRFWEVLLFLFLGILIVLLPRLQKNISIILSKLPKSIIYLLCFVLINGLASCFLAAQYQDWALLEVSHYLFISLLTFLVAGITYKDFNKVFYYFLVTLLAVIIFYLFRIGITYLLYQFGSYPLWPGTETSIGLFGFADKRFFNHIQTWTIPLLVSLGWYYWRYKTRKTVSYILSGLIVGWGILLLATGGRGTVLGLTLGLFVLSFILIRERWKFIQYNFVLAVITIVGYYTFFEWFAKGTNSTIIRGSSTGRFETWRSIIPDIISKPFLGFGPMHYASISLDNWMSSPHNWVLQFAYEWGILVAITLLIVVCVGLYSFANQVKINFNSRSYSEKRKWIKFGLLWSLIAFFIHSFFSGLINSQLSQVWFILIVGFSIGIYYLDKDQKTEADSFSYYWLRYATIVIVLFSFGSFFNWSMKHPIDREKSKQLFLQMEDGNILYPRYWQQGKIGLDSYSPKEKN